MQNQTYVALLTRLTFILRLYVYALVLRMGVKRPQTF